MVTDSFFTATDMKKERENFWNCLFSKTRWNKDVGGVRLDDVSKEKQNRETIGDNSPLAYGINRGILRNLHVWNT